MAEDDLLVTGLAALRRLAATRELTLSDLASLKRRRIPAPMWDFLCRWARREFSVIAIE